jgi:DNA-binding Lrp family transcriptional regulator
VTKFLDRMVEILRGCSHGLTAKEIAERLGVTPGDISSRLSKLAAYGIIKRTRGRTTHNVSACSIYHAPTSVSSTKAHLTAQASSKIATERAAIVTILRKVDDEFRGDFDTK